MVNILVSVRTAQFPTKTLQERPQDAPWTRLQESAQAVLLESAKRKDVRLPTPQYVATAEPPSRTTPKRLLALQMHIPESALGRQKTSAAQRNARPLTLAFVVNACSPT